MAVCEPPPPTVLCWKAARRNLYKGRNTPGSCVGSADMAMSVFEMFARMAASASIMEAAASWAAATGWCFGSLSSE